MGKFILKEAELFPPGEDYQSTDTAYTLEVRCYIGIWDITSGQCVLPKIVS
jgi:hypothetical protein